MCIPHLRSVILDLGRPLFPAYLSFGGAHYGGHFGGGYRGGYWGTGYPGGWHYHGHPGFVFFGGASLFWPPYYSWPYYAYPPYYPSSTDTMPSYPPVYIEQRTGPQLQPLESNGWDYCPNPEGYYPHVKDCPVGWQRIEPQPTGQAPGYWYYCPEPAGYYPYVRTCSAAWQQIVP